VRLFFALWPGERVRAQLVRWSRELRSLCGGRPTPPPNLHLTLAFLGSVESGRMGALERVASAVAPRPAALVLDHPGFWKSNRIVWAGATAVPAGLEHLVLDLRDALARSGIGFDSKPFAAHITLLRDAREPAEMPALEPIRWEVEGFALARSQPGGGPYEILSSWKAAS
jgi:RNA 2',3'-cyclic 3'-phosphodiesterase